MCLSKIRAVASCVRAGNADQQLTGSVGSSKLQETRIHARKQSLEIHQREEVNRLELPIDGWRTTDLRPHRQVRTQQLRDLVTCGLRRYHGHRKSRLWSGA